MNIRERYQMLREFHRRVNEPDQNVPTELSVDHAELRARLILEEALELCEALGVQVTAEGHAHGMILRASPRSRGPRLVTRSVGPVNFIKAVDAMRDIEYVTHGTDLVLGTSDAAEETFEEVHRSNMGKLSGGQLGAKSIKPEGWEPPQLGRILRRIFPKQRLLFEE